VDRVAPVTTPPAIAHWKKLRRRGSMVPFAFFMLKSPKRIEEAAARVRARSMLRATNERLMTVR